MPDFTLFRRPCPAGDEPDAVIRRPNVFPTGSAEAGISRAMELLHAGHFTPGFRAVMGSQCLGLA